MKYTHCTGNKTAKFNCIAHALLNDEMTLMVGRVVEARNQDEASYLFEKSIGGLGLNIEYTIEITHID